MKKKRRQRRSPQRTEVVSYKWTREVHRVVKGFELRVRWAMAERGWNTEDLARACGWSRRYISQQMRNEQIPLEFFERVAKALDLDEKTWGARPHLHWTWRGGGVLKAFELQAEEIEASEKSAGQNGANRTGSKRPRKAAARKAKARK